MDAGDRGASLRHQLPIPRARVPGYLRSSSDPGTRARERVFAYGTNSALFALRSVPGADRGGDPNGDRVHDIEHQVHVPPHLENLLRREDLAVGGLLPAPPADDVEQVVDLDGLDVEHGVQVLAGHHQREVVRYSRGQ